jgi:hypothetical protein
VKKQIQFANPCFIIVTITAICSIGRIWGPFVPAILALAGYSASQGILFDFFQIVEIKTEGDDYDSSLSCIL